MKSVEEIRDHLKGLGLDSRGNKATLKERLRKHLKQYPDLSKKSLGEEEEEDENEEELDSTEGSGERTAIGSAGTEATTTGTQSKKLHPNSRYDYYLCFDVEATCDERYAFEFPNEVIEFPVVLLDGSTLEVVTCLLDDCFVRSIA